MQAYLPLLERCNYLFTGKKIMERLALLIISSTPSFLKHCTNFKPLFMAKSGLFQRFPFSYLRHHNSLAIRYHNFGESLILVLDVG